MFVIAAHAWTEQAGVKSKAKIAQMTAEMSNEEKEDLRLQYVRADSISHHSI